ncbi:carbohydrate ABC transporter permease [Evansella cellulosilytica]|uniref:Binding-protein-dependent transport systems inner membrane component n=1 Tax=Evansella cellulosilytica (strain ATCC 21833 / DSM 2522 / FERM P-1141 / JCM 9156 / N-4) TaxID=649639 RepID=E6TU06_EVAC2|nr:sugar ABC transporter permease [Evansella cellulosilytica]ADU32037.1 binding-protein-dependent transport systems inner membrane component [Evansella cellulosilytica DSM 2522]
METTTTVTLKQNKERRAIGWRMKWRKTIPYWFLLPAFSLYAIFFVLPFIFALYLSFHEWNMINPDIVFVGLNNYVSLFNNEVYWIALRNTGLYVLMTVPISLIAGLGFAIIIESLKRGKVLYRLLFFLPVVSSIAIMGIVWTLMYNPQVGAVNTILKNFGIHGIHWLNDPRIALIAVALVGIWNSFGYNVILFISGLKGIDKSLYEAAALDGANKWQSFKNVTVPMLSPVTFFVFVMSMIASFQVFTTVQIMTKGGPNNATNVSVYHIYQEAFQFFSIGTATASATVLLVVVIVFTVIQLVIGKKLVHYQ